MLQGTASHVGKSVLTAALCRIFRDDGINVAPFKSQNMALNSFVTEEGCEMGRAQVSQAEAAGLVPHVDMNPILIKPHSDVGAQVIIHGKVYGNLSARDFHGFKQEAFGFVEESYKRLSMKHGLIVIEGAGSPAEINLRKNDIANMGTAHMADAPVILVGDIDRGGVFASLVGTLELLDEHDRKRIKGFIINKFRGDLSLLKPGLDFLEHKTGLPVLGVIPYFRDIYIQEEDSVNLEKRDAAAVKCSGKVNIAVIYLPHISNFTDFDPLDAEPDVNLRYVRNGEPIGDADAVIIPGSKNTVGDLKYLKDAGYSDEIREHVEKGGQVIGICGGYQMLGKRIADPAGIEGGGAIEGLGYLEIKTILKSEKSTHQVTATHAKGSFLPAHPEPLKGYEIHMGESIYINGGQPLFEITMQNSMPVTVYDGAATEDVRIWGTYIHGLFDNDIFRANVIHMLKRGKDGFRPGDRVIIHCERKEEGYRKLAKVVRDNIDMEKIYNIAGLG